MTSFFISRLLLINSILYNYDAGYEETLLGVKFGADHNDIKENGEWVSVLAEV